VTARAFAAAETEPSLWERWGRSGRGTEEALGFEFRRFWVGRGVVQDRPEIGTNSVGVYGV
jgi:hypothetical protein